MRFPFPYLKPDHDGRGQFEFFGGLDDSLGDDVAAHDPAEDVDHDGVDLAQGREREREKLDSRSNS